MNAAALKSLPDKDDRYRVYCHKVEYLRDLEVRKKLKISSRSQQLFNCCLVAGVGGGTASAMRPYIPEGLVSSEVAQEVCYSLAAVDICPDYPSEDQDRDLLNRFLEQLSNIGFNTAGAPIAVIEALQTPELKHKQDYLKSLSGTFGWQELHRLQAFLFDYLESRWVGWENNIISEQFAQYVCQQLAGRKLFSDYPTTTQDRYVEQHFRSLVRQAGPFNHEAIAFDKAIASLHQWIDGKDDIMTISSQPTIPDSFIELISLKGWEMINSKSLWVWMAQLSIAMMIDDSSYTIEGLSPVKSLLKSGNLSDKDCLQMASWCAARLQTLESVDNNVRRVV